MATTEPTPTTGLILGTIQTTEVGAGLVDLEFVVLDGELKPIVTHCLATAEQMAAAGFALVRAGRMAG